MQRHYKGPVIFCLIWLLLGVSGCQEPTAAVPGPTAEAQATQPAGEIELHYKKSVQPGEELIVQATNHSPHPVTFYVPDNGDYCLHVYRDGKLVRHLEEMGCDVFAALLLEPGMTRYVLGWDGMVCDGDDRLCAQRSPALPGTYTFDIAYEVQSEEGESPVLTNVEGIFVVVP